MYKKVLVSGIFFFVARAAIKRQSMCVVSSKVSTGSHNNRIHIRRSAASATPGCCVNKTAFTFHTVCRNAFRAGVPPFFVRLLAFAQTPLSQRSVKT
jgi:hypothetical protein